MLISLISDLQLREDQIAKATESYKSVTSWLGQDDSPVTGVLYPQGSLALDTTVRPMTRAEFDLDIVCVMNDRDGRSPEEVYDLVWERMQEHGTYRPIMERLPRCIRLNYAESSQFHLDIVPAVPDATHSGTFILIPNKPSPGRRMNWQPSNPKGFMRWFEDRKTVLQLEAKFARASVEPLGRPLPAEQKAALTKSVQLLKRWRDVKWNDSPELATPSIILTYLAANYYRGESLLTEAMSTILDGLVQFVASGEREIEHPANENEIISEKWLSEPRAYTAFAESVELLRDDWSELSATRGISALKDRMQELFGDSSLEAIKSVQQTISGAKSGGSLYVEKRTGNIIAGSPAAASLTGVVKPRPHTYYGD